MGTGRDIRSTRQSFGVAKNFVSILLRDVQRVFATTPRRVRKKASIADAFSLQADLPSVSADRFLIESADTAVGIHQTMTLTSATGGKALFLCQGNRKNVTSSCHIYLQKQHISIEFSDDVEGFTNILDLLLIDLRNDHTRAKT